MYEAKHDQLVVILKQDLTKARRKDPDRCAISLALKRQLGAVTARIWKSVAFISLPDEKGKLAVYRFTLSASATKYVSKYDRTGKIPYGVGLLLKAPRKAATLEYARQRHANLRKGLDVKGHPRKPGRRAGCKIALDTSVRNGRGSLALAVVAA